MTHQGELSIAAGSCREALQQLVGLLDVRVNLRGSREAGKIYKAGKIPSQSASNFPARRKRTRRLERKDRPVKKARISH